MAIKAKKWFDNNYFFTIIVIFETIRKKKRLWQAVMSLEVNQIKLEELKQAFREASIVAKERKQNRFLTVSKKNTLIRALAVTNEARCFLSQGGK